MKKLSEQDERDDKLFNLSVLAFFFVFGVLSMAWVSACGSITPRSATYTAVAEVCIAKQEAIVGREGTTQAEDLAAINSVREVCDQILSVVQGAPTEDAGTP